MLHCRDIGRANGELRALRTPVSDGSTRSANAAAKNAPVPAAQPAGSRGAILAAHARSLDSRLQVAAQTDRQATRRAAAHVVQLARRIARLLPRVPSLLPVLPDGGRDSRVRHYVLQAQQVTGTTGTRILTISTHSVLRYGEFDGSGKPVLWNEYDPLQPVVGWDLEVVLERLAQVLGQIQEQVENLEARVAERASTLNSLLNAAPLQRSAGTSSKSAPAAAIAAKAAAPAPARPPAAVPKSAAVPPVQQVPEPGIADNDAPLVSYGGDRPTSNTPARAVARAIPDSIDAAMDGGRDGAIDGATDDAMDGTTEGTIDELSLIDLAFSQVEQDDAADVAHDPTHDPTHDDSLDSLFDEVAAPATMATDTKTEATPEASAADAGAERDRRERRLFQHLRVR